MQNHNSLDATSLARKDIVSLFSDEIPIHSRDRLPFQDYRKSRGLYNIFGTCWKSSCGYIPYGQAIDLLKNFTHLTAFCREYASRLGRQW